MTHDALDTYVADRMQAREHAATVARSGRLLRRVLALRATGPTGPATVNPAPVPASPASSPVVVEAATATTTAGTTAEVPTAA